jgi:ABC-type transport system substrate-binding protein
MRAAVAVVALVAAGCFERGGARPRGGDGGAAVAVDAAPRPERAHREPAGPADPAATIRVALEAEPASLDPLTAADAVARRVLADVYEGLVCAAPTLGATPVPCLADRYEEADGGRRWTFHLRDARWHDGAAVTSADVVATLAAVRARGSWLVGELDDLVGVDAPAPDTVVLRFGALRPDRLARLASVPILPRHALDAAAPPGTGPMRLDRWVRGDRIELSRWDGHWGAPAAAARVIYRIAERGEALRLLADGELDVVVQVPIDEATRFADDHAAAGTFTYRLGAYLAAIYNARRPALATAAARRALTALLDRDQIAARLFGTRPITGPFPETDPGHDPSVSAVPFDRAVAEALLAGRRPRLEVLVPAGSATMARVADIWASDARGVAELIVVEVPFAELLGRLAAGTFDVALLSMTTGPELDLAPRLSSRAPADTAWSGIADRELDRLLDAVKAEPDPDRRAQLRRALHRRIAAVDPLAFIAADVRLGVARRDIGGVAGAAEGAPPRAARLWRAAPR